MIGSRGILQGLMLSYTKKTTPVDVCNSHLFVYSFISDTNYIIFCYLAVFVFL